MSSFNPALPRLSNGEPDMDVWLDEASQFSPTARQKAVAVFELLTEPESRHLGLAVVELLLELKMDITTVMAGMTTFAVQRGTLEVDQLPSDTAALVNSVLPLAATNVLAFSNSAVLASESKSQTDNVRGMLIALIDDPRVAVIKLAERVVALRDAKQHDDMSRWVIAQEAMEFYAPLAGRLGIWSLKWNLEDLAFSVLHPVEYREIAAKLTSRRDERERHVEAIRQDLAFRLAAVNINAEVQGRAKHIYSIWRKMNHKSIDFSEVRDVQAVRVLVDNVEECYLALGVVHTSWPPIPGELDDYVASPKENGYRSIHTAVIGPKGITLEVQIRTREMHEESELGVCAHWAYKDDGNGYAGLETGKAEWLRSILEWHDEVGAVFNGGYVGQDRIFVTTPAGHVLDMAPNATPVDFAYRVHTEVGHRCRGARVNGRQVPLNRRLATGECIEIDTGDTEAPRREWLNPALGYVNTARARTKIQAWFRNQLAESNINAGRALLEETLTRLDLSHDFAALATLAGYPGETDLLMAVGVGDQLVIDLVRLLSSAGPEDLGAEPREPGAGTGSFHGFVVCGNDRDGLLRDITSAVAERSISVVAANARVDVATQTATITMELHVDELSQLAQAVDDIQRIPDVLTVRRKRADDD
ncbi:MAG: HD domain-containing protein [Gammaproteobacteria bacterium]|nr:HD domain-containing protein [Gammaproteobacteria bacterium]